MTLDVLSQDAFSSGIVRVVEGQRIPDTGVYDLVNALIEDDVGAYRRGGSAFLSTSNAGATLLGLADMHLAGGPRTIMWAGTSFYTLDGSEGPVTVFSGLGSALKSLSRPAGLGGLAGFVNVDREILIYGGTRKTADYSTGTVTVTANSNTVTGVGTAWTANVDPGMLFTSTGGFRGVVHSVDSNTQITLLDPWGGSTAAGQAYTLDRVRVLTYSGFGIKLDPNSPVYISSVGNSRRLLIGCGNRVYFSAAGDPLSLDKTDYHELPGGSEVTGLDSIGSDAVVFTSTGTFAISNMDYDLTDDFGNPQQSMARMSANLILWGDSGVASYRSSLVVPALDDVYLVSVGAQEVPVSVNIRGLYRSYVKAGYRPGLATVYRGHYFLPIVNGTALIDTLVCRLDSSTPAWTRWDGHASSIAYAQRFGTATTSPKLLAIKSQRVLDLAGAFEPAAGNKNDADGTTHVFSLVTRDYAVSRQIANLWKYLRTRFQLTDAASDNPTLTAEYAVGPPELESWTSIGSWAEGTGEASSKLSVNKRAQSIRFRFKTSGPTAKFVLRSLELFFRQSGKQ